MVNLSLSKIFTKPYIFYFILVFAVYLFLNIILSGFYDTIPLIIIYAKTLSWLKLGFSIFLSLFIGFLVALVSVMIFVRYKERKECKRSVTLAGVGTVSGLTAGICPLCVTGILPIILGGLGISFSFASLPFQGIEVQILTLFILIISLFLVIK